MKVKPLILFVSLILVTGLYAQTGRSVSKPGRIENPVKVKREELKSSDIQCEISYSDPTGDNTLGVGETGTVTVLVKNNGKAVLSAPKLEISYYTSWNPSPRDTIKWMETIQPGGTGQHKVTMKWDENLPSGTVTYSAKLIETKTNIVSESSEFTFYIAGAGEDKTEPVFVDVDKTIPRLSMTNPNGIAVIIGNYRYTNKDVPNVDYAKNDASTMKQYLINMLGYRDANIICIENAAKADFERVFGTERVLQGKLYNWVKPQESDVVIYYSGHGAPDTKNRKAYFMPSNSDPNYIQIDGYPLDIFYRNLDKIPARSITVILDACFSGGSHEGMLLSHASPMTIDVDLPFHGDHINLFTSATGSQISSWYPEGRHTLFTYYFLRALRGEADKNRDRNITLNEVRTFLNEHVPYMARRLYGREQTPIVKGDADQVICKY